LGPGSKFGNDSRKKTLLTMRSSSQPRSLLRAVAWVYFWPLVVVGGFALLALGFGVLAVVLRLVAALLKYAGV
jgi:hypothetical protein